MIGEEYQVQCICLQKAQILANFTQLEFFIISRMDKEQPDTQFINNQLLMQSIHDIQVNPNNSPPQRLVITPTRNFQTIPRKPPKKRLNYSAHRLKYSPQIYARPSTHQLTSKQDLLNSTRIKMRSSSRKKRFESKVERLVTDSDSGIKVYEGELEYLRKRLETCENEKLLLEKNVKLVKNQELEVALAKAYLNMDELRGQLAKANEIIAYYQETVAATGKKKSMLKRLREQNIVLEGELHATKVVLDRLNKITNEAEQDKAILKSKIDALKKQLNEVHLQQNMQTRARRNTGSETHREFSIIKKKNSELENQIEKLKSEKYALEKELGTMKNELLFRDMKIENLTKKNQELANQKGDMQSSFIARLRDMQENRKEIQRQRSTIVYQVKVRDKKRLVSRDQVGEIARKLRFKFIRQKIQYKKIIDITRFKDSFRPTFKQIQQMLSCNPFNLQYDQQLLFTKYLLQNDAPLDSDEQQRYNNTPIIRAILEKAIDPYDLIINSEHSLQESLISLFDNNKTLIETVKKNMAKKQTEYIELQQLRKYFKEYFVEVKDTLYLYMELKSFEICNRVDKINLMKLQDYVEGLLKKHNLILQF